MPGSHPPLQSVPTAGIHRIPVYIHILLFVSTAAEFIFLSASAWTRIVTSDLVCLYNSTGFLLLKIKLFTFLRGKDLVPLWKIVKPVSLSVYHVLVKKLFVKTKTYGSILIHSLDRVLNLKAVIDSIKETNHGEHFLIIFLSQLFNCTSNYFVRILKKLCINVLLNVKIFCPELLKFITICLQFSAPTTRPTKSVPGQ